MISAEQILSPKRSRLALAYGLGKYLLRRPKLCPTLTCLFGEAMSRKTERREKDRGVVVVCVAV